MLRQPLLWLASWRRLVLVLSGSALLLGLEGLLHLAPSLAADQIKLMFGSDASSSSSGLSIMVADLKTYAETSTPPPALQSLLSFLKPADQSQLLTALQTKIKIDVTSLEALLNSADGQKILMDVAAATLRPGAEGVQALRSALLTSASAPEGWGVIGFLKAYPDSVLTIDITQAQKLVQLNEQLFAANRSRLDQLVQPPATAPGTTVAPNESPQPAPTTP